MDVKVFGGYLFVEMLRHAALAVFGLFWLSFLSSRGPKGSSGNHSSIAGK